MSSGTPLRSTAGITLVELMVSVAIMSIFSMALGTLFVDTTRKKIYVEQQSELLDKIEEFTNVTESTLSGITRVRYCGCGADCSYDATPPNCQDPLGCTSPAAAGLNSHFLEVEVEDSQEPEKPAAPNCYRGGVKAANTAQGLISRGCKRLIRLYYTQATPNVGLTAGQPGRLQIVDVTNATGTGAAAPGRMLAQINGIYRLNCGLTPRTDIPGNIASMTQFKLSLALKHRRDRRNTVPAGQLPEGFFPGSTAPLVAQDNGFLEGFHREIESTIPLQNLTTYGVHFGRSLSFSNCTRDGQPNADGNCCSGFWSAGNCLAPQNCLVRNTATVSKVACCSHNLGTINGVAGVCL